jgi:hypothetical protein
MTDIRNTEYVFSEVEESIIKNFILDISADRVEKDKNQYGKEVFKIVTGLTEIEVEKQSVDSMYVNAKNVKQNSHYLGGELTTPVELLKELEQLKLRLK